MLKKLCVVDSVLQGVTLDCKADSVDNELFHFMQLTAENQEMMWINVGLRHRSDEAQAY